MDMFRDRFTRGQTQKGFHTSRQSQIRPASGPCCTRRPCAPHRKPAQKNAQAKQTNTTINILCSRLGPHQPVLFSMAYLKGNERYERYDRANEKQRHETPRNTTIDFQRIRLSESTYMTSCKMHQDSQQYMKRLQKKKGETATRLSCDAIIWTAHYTVTSRAVSVLQTKLFPSC